MQTILQDFRFALRQLLKSPGFTSTAILSLALGIGATTAVFSVVYAILMNPYPYAGANRMVHLRTYDQAGEETGFGVTAGQWQQLRHAPVVDDAFISDDWNLTVTGNDLPEDLQGVYVTSNTFQYMGVPPALGRGIMPADAIDGQEPQPVVVLGYKFWQRHFNSDPAVLGRTLQLVRKNYTIVGVAAQRFTWDDGDVYLPLKVTQDRTRRYYVGVRLKPGITHAQADAALAPLIAEFAKETPDNFPKAHLQFHVVGLNDDFVKSLGGTLALLFSAVILLLAIGCGNVSILLLARGTSRQHEFAVRCAIGAGRLRLLRQLLTESVTLSLAGVVLGVLLAYRLLALITSWLPPYAFPHEASIQINFPVLLFSVAVAILTGVLFGLWPSLQLSKPEVSQIMQSTARKIAGGVRGRKSHNILIAGQIALTMVMMAGAAASIEGFLRILHAPLGYDPHNVMSVGIPVHDGTYTTWAARSAFFEELRDRISKVPGVRMVGISSNATPPANGADLKVEAMGRPAQNNEQVRVNFVSPDYFPVLRIPLLQGRLWDKAENHNGARLVVVNETMARRFFPNDDALNHFIRIPDLKAQAPYLLAAPGADGWLQIVGVVADKRNDGLRKPILPEVFLPDNMLMRMWTQILVRSDVPPLTLLHAVATEVNKIDPDQQIAGKVEDLEHWISDQTEWQQEHLIAWLFGGFAFLALALAALGLYSVVSYTVAQRTNEFGIRMALGAQRSHVLSIVISSTISSIGSGVGLGILLTLALNKVLAHWSEESVRDPFLLVFVVAVLGAVAALSCSVPAWRAAKVEPVTALRYE